MHVIWGETEEFYTLTMLQETFFFFNIREMYCAIDNLFLRCDLKEYMNHFTRVSMHLDRILYHRIGNKQENHFKCELLIFDRKPWTLTAITAVLLYHCFPVRVCSKWPFSHSRVFLSVLQGISCCPIFCTASWTNTVPFFSEEKHNFRRHI